MRIESNRADLVSAGDALVAVRLPRKVDPDTVTVTLGDRDVTDRFAVREDGRYLGLVRGLAVGKNVVRAAAPGYAGETVITNHPNGGPIFSGPQHGPYRCQDSAVDAQCNQPPTYSFLYKSTDPTQPGLQPYDPEDPPSDVATTTSDEGVGVPFIVRREDGFQARDRYTILALFTPGQDWTPCAPGAVEPQGPDPPRRQLRRVVRPGQPAARRLRRHHPERSRASSSATSPRWVGASPSCRPRSTTPGTTATSRSRPSR